MSCFGNDRPFRPLGRLAELKAHNQNSKRVFGKDITNHFDGRLKKNTSNYEKAPVEKIQENKRSQSFRGRQEYKRKPSINIPQGIDPIKQYEQQILDFMVSLQKIDQKDNQQLISEKMRGILIDWLIDVHESFQLKEQTLHLALSYLSDFSAICQISKEEYQLYGIACLWIASKYEEIYPPRTKNYIEVTDNAYTLHDLKRAEGKIIQKLQFNMNRTTSLQLLEAISENIPQKSVCFTKYLLELAYMEQITKKYKPYTLVKAALSVAESVAGIQFNIKLNSSIQKIPREQIVSCFKDLCVSMKTIGSKPRLTALKRKFAHSKYHQVSKIKINLQQ